jgi:deoxyribodipyrimidine photolyase
VLRKECLLKTELKKIAKETLQGQDALVTSVMNTKFQKTLFVFRRDLRLEDNTGLIFAVKSSEVVIPAFIFTPEQIEHNAFRSDHCLKFMLESLQDLLVHLNKN